MDQKYVIVPVEFVGGIYVAENPKPIALSGTKGEQFSLLIIPVYDCSEPQNVTFTERIKAFSTNVDVTIGARTEEYFEFQSVFQTGTFNIEVTHDVAFRRSDGTTQANLHYAVQFKVVADVENPAPPKDSTYGVSPPSRSVIYVKPGATDFYAMVGDAYYGHEEGLLEVVDFVPADASDKRIMYESFERLPGNGGVRVDCHPLAELTSYSLKIQVGNESSEDDLIKFWVTTKREL